jgi:hypothetical protein
MAVSERIVTIVIIALTAIAALFCVIGLATKGWIQNQGLFCDGCPKAAQAMSILSFIFLLICVVAFVLRLLELLRGPMQFAPVVILFICVIFLQVSYTSFVAVGLGYSFDLMVIAHFLSYVALAAAAFVAGQTRITST